MTLPPFRRLYKPDDDVFNRAMDAVSTAFSPLLTKPLLITDESALFLEASVTVPTDWTTIADASMTNSWVTFDASTNQPVQYRKTVDGMVELIGVIKNGVVGSACFTLPSGYRPSLLMNFSAASNGAFGIAQIANTGVVTPAVGSNVYFDFGLVRFPASDRTPAPLSCWPIQIPCALPTEPNGVLVASCREQGTGRYVATADPDWSWTSSSGQSFLVIRNVPWLPPGRSYDITFLVMGET